MKKTNAEAWTDMNKKMVLVIVSAVVILGGVGVYLLINNSNSDKTPSNNGDSSKSTDKDAAVSKKYSDACTVFTKEAISAALGGTYGDGKEGIAISTGTPGSDNYEDLMGSECAFDQDNDGSTAGMTAALNLTVAINNYASVADAKQFMNDLHNPQTAEGKEAVGTPTDVEGVGDQAFFPVLKTAQGSYEKTEVLYVLSGRQVIVLTVVQLDGVDRNVVRTGLTALGKQL